MQPYLEKELYGGIQKLYKFANNQGASVIRHQSSYGNEDGLWELAVLKFDEYDDWEIDYSTEITGDVIGYLTESEVEEILKQIEAL